MTTALYREPLATFLKDVQKDAIAAILTTRGEAELPWPPSKGEIASWRASLPHLAHALEAAALQHSDVFVELLMPACSKRCDVLLTGADDLNRPSAVVVELKQWTMAEPSRYDEHVIVGKDVRLHPSVQVRTYAEQLRHYHSAFTSGSEAEIVLAGCAYLHDCANAKALAFLRNGPFHADANAWPIFGKSDAVQLSAWLRWRLCGNDAGKTAVRIAAGKVKPSEKLTEILVELVKGEREYTLVDEQRLAFFAVRSAVQLAKDRGEKTVVIIRGGPGTGKSVLAIQLLAHAARQGWVIVHATGSKAFSTVLKGRTIAFARKLMLEIWKKKTFKEVPVDDLFTTFANVARVGADRPGCIDLLVCDEAHRLWAHRRKATQNGHVYWQAETDMVAEVIESAQVATFFIDDNQAVRAGEIGHSDMVRDAAKRLGRRIEEVDLETQFRCAGSASWIAWVDGLLGFRDRLDSGWVRDKDYELVPFDDPAKMESWLHGRAAGGERCRLVAGFCWKWSDPDGLGNLPLDIEIGNWQAAWIERREKDLKPLEDRYYRWATNDSLMAQVGSIYSVQGFEFDRVGVIWGDDLVWRNGAWIAQLDACKDKAFKRDLGNDVAAATVKLRNVYRVLLTRGMRSTGVHIIDAETRAHVMQCMLASYARKAA